MEDYQKVILTVEEIDSSSIGLVVNGEPLRIEPKFRRMIIAGLDANLPGSELVSGISLESGGKQQTTYQVVGWSRKREALLNNSGTSFACERLPDQCLIMEKDLIMNYYYTRPMKVLAFDIECYSDGSGLFPKSDINPIVSVGYCKIEDDTNKWTDYPVDVIMGYSEGRQDQGILETFMKLVEDFDPDVVVHFSGWAFDIPYLEARCRLMKIKNTLHRKFPFTDHMYRDNAGHLFGRVSFDTFIEAKRDQTIRALPSHSLDNLAKHFNIEGKLGFDTGNTAAYLNAPELYDYCKQDVAITAQIAEGYFRNIKTVAAISETPIANFHEGSEAWLPKIQDARELHSRGVISTTTNQSRYPAMLRTDKKGQELKYRAAYVDVYGTGRFGGECDE